MPFLSLIFDSRYINYRGKNANGMKGQTNKNNPSSDSCPQIPRFFSPKATLIIMLIVAFQRCESFYYKDRFLTKIGVVLPESLNKDRHQTLLLICIKASHIFIVLSFSSAKHSQYCQLPSSLFLLLPFYETFKDSAL